MSTKLLSLAAELADTNPAGSQLIINLTKAETGAEIADVLDEYDTAVLNAVTEAVAV